MICVALSSQGTAPCGAKPQDAALHLKALCPELPYLKAACLNVLYIKAMNLKVPHLEMAHLLTSRCGALRGTAP